MQSKHRRTTESSAESPATLMFAPAAALKGRGTVWALEHRFSTDMRADFDDG